MADSTMRVVSPVLVGRDAELRTLVETVLSPPAIVVVDGEAGVGKTRFISESLDVPDLARTHRLVGRCRAIRESFPLGPIIEAVRGLPAELRGVRLSPVAGALRGLLPELAEVLPPPPEPLDDPVAERHRVFRGLLDLLRALGPCVLVVEDLQWADEHTTDFLAYLVSDPPSPRLAVVLSYRTEEAGPAVRAISTRPAAGYTGVQVSLPLLDHDGTKALVEAILDTDAVSPALVELLRQRTSGLPLAVEEVLALARDRGLMTRRDGRWQRKALAELDVPSGIRDATLARVARLPAAAQRVVEATAVLQEPVGLGVLRAMFGRATDVEGYDEAVGSGLLVERAGSVGFRHLLAAQAVHADLGSAYRRRLHGAAADALRTAEPVPLSQVAHHLRRADRLVEWATAAEEAADHAVELGNAEGAAHLLEGVLRTAPLEVDRRGRLAVKLGRAAQQTMNSADVIDVLTAAARADVDRSVRGELRLLLVRAMNQRGDDIENQVALLTEAVEDLGEDPALQAEAMAGLGVLSPRSMSRSERARWLNRAADTVGRTGDPAHEAWILSRVGGVMCASAEPVWRGQADRVMAITGGAPRRHREVNAHYILAVPACWSGHLDTARRLLHGCREAPATAESSRLEVQVRSAVALLAFCAGNWDGLAAEVARLSDEMAGALAEAGLDIHLVAGWLALAHGELDDARRRLDQVLGAAERLDDLLIIPTAVALSAQVAIADGEADRAADLVRGHLDVLSETAWAPFARLLPTATEALVAAGRPDEAAGVIERTERVFTGMDAPLAEPALRYARGVLGESAAEFAGAAESYDAAGAPYEAARARERAAAELLATDPEAAMPVLRAAVATYDRLGASWDRARAANLARRHDVTLPPLHRGGKKGYGSRLSPREQQVAELAAAGRTNTEIAKALFVSKNTVEKQLGAAMRKLQVRSRVELAHRLTTAQTNDGGTP